MEIFIRQLILGSGTWRLLRHVLFWSVMYIDEIFYTFVDPEGFEDLHYAIAPLLVDMLLVYSNMYILIPALLRPKKYIAYATVSLGSIFIVAIIYIAILSINPETAPDVLDHLAILLSNFTILSTALFIKISKYSYQQLKEKELLKQEQTLLELNYLKQQINPHFLFNILNTINVQSKKNPKSVSETVIKLSNLLRYQIYDAGKTDKVQLQKEIEFIHNYVELERLRRHNLDVKWNGLNKVPKHKVTPFLFLPLIENAFKHSANMNDSVSTIEIQWQATNDIISVVVKNTIGDIRHKEGVGGFGIENLKKRLELLYPNSYELTMSRENRQHIATLSIHTHQ